MSDERVFILGATSAIASAFAERRARTGASFHLVARDARRLDTVAGHLKTLGATRVTVDARDLAEPASAQAAVTLGEKALGAIDVAVIAHGILGSQAEAESNFAAARLVLEVDLMSPIAALTSLADVMERAGKGSIIVLGSVAGDRGRRSNYVYGAAKGALALYAQGLRARLHGRGVHVLTVKPGFVDTPMTAGLPKNFLYASPARVAHGIERAWRSRRDIAYVPCFWRWILWLVRLVPERISKRMHW